MPTMFHQVTSNLLDSRASSVRYLIPCLSLFSTLLFFVGLHHHFHQGRHLDSIDWRGIILGPLDARPPVEVYTQSTVAPFAVMDLADWDQTPLPVPYPPRMRFPASEPVHGMAVPNIVHYVKWSEDGLGHDLAYWEYLSIRSVILVQSPETIYFHCNVEPEGAWWNEVAAHITISIVQMPDRIYNNEVYHLAHKSDIIRLLVLEQLGGIYLDLDIYLIRPLDDLMYQPMTMGMQGEDYGLCNSVLISAPHSKWINRYIDSYRDFDGSKWDWNSVIRSLEIAKKYPDEIQIMLAKAFFSPDWDLDGKVWEDESWDFDAKGQFLYHAWHAGFRDRLEALSPWSITEKATNFNTIASRYVGAHDQDIWRIKAGDVHVE